jgi:hypothetical protein
MEKNQYQDVEKLTKGLAVAWAIIYCIAYLIMMRTNLTLKTIAVPFHLCLIFISVFVTGLMPGVYKWKSIELYVAYHSFVMITQMWIGVNLMNYMFNHPNGYTMILSEIIALIIFAAYGGFGGLLISLVFKLFQALMWECPYYESDDITVKPARKISKVAFQDKLNLEIKNETELNVMLKEAHAEEKWELAAEIKKVLERKYR